MTSAFIAGILLGAIFMNTHDCQVEIDSTLTESVNRHVVVKSVLEFWKDGQVDSQKAVIAIHNLYFPDAPAKFTETKTK